MKVRALSARARLRPRSATLASGALIVFASLGITACTSSGNPSASGSNNPTISASGSISGGATPSFFTASAPGNPGSGTSGSGSASASPSASPSPSPSPSATEQAPIGAPSTGGGGTAGVQDMSLFLLGGAAVLVGIGSLAYRRRTLNR